MTVYNRKTQKIPNGALFIGRPSKWGNPYIAGRDGTREEVIKRYGEYIIEKIDKKEITLEELADLDGMDLVCYCKPLSCHGDVLESLAKEAAIILGYRSN